MGLVYDALSKHVNEQTRELESSSFWGAVRERIGSKVEREKTMVTYLGSHPSYQALAREAAVSTVLPDCVAAKNRLLQAAKVGPSFPKDSVSESGVWSLACLLVSLLFSFSVSPMMMFDTPSGASSKRGPSLSE